MFKYNELMKNKFCTITIVKSWPMKFVMYFWIWASHSIECHGGMIIIMTYEMTIKFFMLTSLKMKGNFIPCEHFHFMHKINMFCNYEINDFLNQPI
jgi:hypothetical protein